MYYKTREPWAAGWTEAIGSADTAGEANPLTKERDVREELQLLPKLNMGGLVAAFAPCSYRALVLNGSVWPTWSTHI